MSRSQRINEVVGRVPGALWAALGGFAWALCFGERGLLLAPWLALAPIFFLLGRPRAVALTWIHGTAFWLASLYWIVPTLMTFGRLPVALAAFGLLLLAMFLSLLFWIPFGFLGRRLWLAGGWPLALGLPALWTALEWMREYIFSGFPWNLAAYAAVAVPGARPLTALTGAYGLTFLLVAVNAGVAVSLRDRRKRPVLIAAGVAAGALLVGLAISPGSGLGPGPRSGLGSGLETGPGLGEPGGEVRVLQPNIYNLVEWDRAKAEANYQSALSQADEACTPGALVILPESAVWPYIYGREPRLAADLARLAERGCRLLINSISEVANPAGASSEDSGAEVYYNSALLVGLAISPGSGLGPGPRSGLGSGLETGSGLSEVGGEVRVLQPNIYNLVEWDRAKAEANYQSALSQADEACIPGALVILPESAVWPYIYGREPRLAADLARLAERGCRLLINSISEVASPAAASSDGSGAEDSGAEVYYNSALLIGANGIEGRYDKRHLVPFGEYVPFGGLFAWLDKLARMAGDFAAGTEPGLLAWGDERLGTAICYEVVYAGNVALQVQAGATLLVTTTNDAWYGDSTAPWQHLRAAQFRAAEHARTMLRAAISGVSAVIAPDGSLVSHLGVGERGILAARVVGRSGLTVYARAPWLVPLAATFLALSAYANVRSRRRRSK